MLFRSPTFVVHLADKSIASYSLVSLKKENDKRTVQLGEGTVPFSTIEYADGYFQLIPKSTLAPGQYLFFYMPNVNFVDHLYSFEVK